MPISNTDTRREFVGNGVDNSPYSLATFPLRRDEDIQVVYITDATGVEVAKTVSTDYTVTIAEDNQSGSITLVTTAPATGETLLIRRNSDMKHLETYEDHDGFPSDTLDGDLDQNHLQHLTLQEQLDRTIRVAKGHGDANLPLDTLNLVDNAEKIISVKDDETGFEFIVNADSPDATAGPDPASSTDNAVVRWDGATGRLLQNSVVTIGDTGDIVTAGTYTAGSGVVVLTNADGTIKQGAINSAIAGTNITYTSGVLSVAAGGGLGDVTGPASSTDLAIARWDGATGQLLQDSTVTLTGTGTISDVFVIRSSASATQSTPPYSFTGRTGDGLFSSGVDIVGLATGGIERMSLSATLMDIASGVDVTINGGDLTVSGTITAGSGATLLTNADGTIKQGAINSAIAGTGITYTSGVLSVVASLGGDVVGPGSATDSAIARFDLTTGKIIQNSSATIDDVGDMVLMGTLTAGSGSEVLTNANGTIKQGAINSAIAGTGITYTSGVLSVVASLGGDVVGPGSSTDNAIARFNLATGKLLQNSAVLVDDSGNMTGIGLMKVGNGTAALPSIAPTSDTDMGFSFGTVLIAASVGGSRIVFINASGIHPNASESASLGTSSARWNTVHATFFKGDDADSPSDPSFSWPGDSNSGLNRISANNIGLAVNAVNEVTISTTQIIIPTNDLILSAGDIDVTGDMIVSGNNLPQLGSFATKTISSNSITLDTNTRIYQITAIGTLNDIVAASDMPEGTLVIINMQDLAETGTFAHNSGTGDSNLISTNNAGLTIINFEQIHLLKAASGWKMWKN